MPTLGIKLSDEDFEEFNNRAALSGLTKSELGRLLILSESRIEKATQAVEIMAGDLAIVSEMAIVQNQTIAELNNSLSKTFTYLFKSLAAGKEGAHWLKGADAIPALFKGLVADDIDAQ